MSGGMYFILAVAGLFVGYFIYGTVVDKIFGSNPNRATPAIAKADGVDFVHMNKGRIWLIQLLNIAGVGPIFGPILGALYGPSALLWIVFGSIFAGGVHDYLAGMLSVRHGGDNVPNIVGYTLGKFFKQFMRLLTVVLLLLVGVVFVTAPAKMLSDLNSAISTPIWIVIIFAYYFLATILPIDKIIGRFYPIFGAILIIMALGITGMLFLEGSVFYPAAEWTNQHPKDLPLWPLMFITIACGAISGFHATQSPLMARCIENEKHGKSIFYGSMIAEGFIALVWATVGMTFYQSPEMLQETLNAGGPGKVVHDASYALMGSIGGLLAIIGVIILPITSGDTAFRAARLTIAEMTNFSQQEIVKRLTIAVPLFTVGAILSPMNFDILWRYFGWANQTLAAVVLWAGAAYLYRNGRFHFIASLPAVVMTAATVSYICYMKGLGFGLPIMTANIIGASVAAAAFALFLIKGKTVNVEQYSEQ